MILCVNPNAAIDKTVIVSPFQLDQIHRPQQVLAFPGGKGCNVARALSRLGETAIVTGWVGGYAGQFIEGELQQEGIQTAFVHTDFESRTCLSILDPDNQTLTEIYERGEPVPANKVEELKTHFKRIMTGCTAVTLSGSLPTGVPVDFYSHLITSAHEAGVLTFLDSSGDALKNGLAANPFLIKPNKKEFTDLAGKELVSRADFAEAAVKIAIQYETLVVLSLGPEGAIAANNNTVLLAHPPQVTATSAVGSGDSMLAGLAYGLTHQQSLEESLKGAVAAGTANTLRVGAGHFTLDDFERIRSQVMIEYL